MKQDGSWNYDRYNGPELMHRQAMAYADCAIELCKRMKSGDLECTFLRGQAALYLGFHSTELFLKAAILHRTNDLITCHDLRKLRSRYEELFADKRFQIRTHFQTLYVGIPEDQVVELMKKENPTDQTLRYPIGKNKAKWWESEIFDANACLEQFREYREDMERVGIEIYKENQ
jgi:hypothetical protein